MVDFFRRGRGLTVLCAAIVGFLAFSVFVDNGYLHKLLLSASLVLGFFLAALWISSIKKAEGIDRATLRRVQQLEQMSADLLAHDKSRQQGSQRKVLDALNSRSGLTGELERSGGVGNEGLFFAPKAVPASKIIGRPAAQQAGRIAAEQDMESDGSAVLRALWGADKAARKRGIELVGSKAIEDELRGLGCVKRLMAPHELGEPDPRTAYLVIEEAALGNGPWSGVLNTQGTANFLALSKYIRESKFAGVLVIVVESSSQEHFSNELRSMATVVVKDGKPQWEWEKDINLPVVSLIAEVSGKGNK